MRRCTPVRAGIVIVLTVVTSRANGADGRVERAESRAEVNRDGSAGRVVNRTFEAVTEGSVRILLRKEIQRTFDADSGPGRGRVQIDAWRLPRARGDRPLYTISDDGDDVEWLLYPLFLTLRVHGCCDSNGSRAVFNAQTGKMLLSANAPAGYLSTITRGSRIVLLIGVHDVHGGRLPRLFPPHRDGHMPLLVTAADQSGCRAQTVFDVPIPSGTDAYVTSVSWDRLTPRVPASLDVDLRGGERLDATLKIVLSDKRTLSIPVGEGGADPQRMVLPAGVTVRIVSPCSW